MEGGRPDRFEQHLRVFRHELLPLGRITDDGRNQDGLGLLFEAEAWDSLERCTALANQNGFVDENGVRHVAIEGDAGLEDGSDRDRVHPPLLGQADEPLGASSSATRERLVSLTQQWGIGHGRDRNRLRGLHRPRWPRAGRHSRRRSRSDSRGPCSALQRIPGFGLEEEPETILISTVVSDPSERKELVSKDTEVLLKPVRSASLHRVLGRRAPLLPQSRRDVGGRLSPARRQTGQSVCES